MQREESSKTAFAWNDVHRLKISISEVLLSMPVLHKHTRKKERPVPPGRLKGEPSHNSFSEGFRHGIPIGLGYFSVSIAFGIKAVSGGLTPFEAVLISLTNLTSAGQFAGITVIAAGASLLEMALTQLVVNLRYALMSLSLIHICYEPVKEYISRLTDQSIEDLDRSIDRDGLQDHRMKGQIEWYTLPENVYRAYQLFGDEKYKEHASAWHYD